MRLSAVRPCNCGNVKPTAYTLDQCRKCWSWENVPAYRVKCTNHLRSGGSYQLSAASAAAAQVTPTRPRCARLGEPTGETATCPTCSGRVELKLFACAAHGDCTTHKPASGKACCVGCKQYRTVPLPSPKPLALHTITASDLGHAANDHVSNASITRWRGKLVLLYRRNWLGADLWVRELNEDFTPAPGVSRMLNLHHRHARFGREDGRFFEHNGAIHVAYVGVEGERGPCSMLYARLRDDLTVERIFYPELPGRGAWEKNWSFFSAYGLLWAVQHIGPEHVVLRIEGDRAEVAHRHPFTPAWSGGFLRGGASPVLVGDRFVSWFHGKHRIGGIITYTTGVYTFAADMPFTPTACTPTPVMHGDPDTRPKNWHINNWFPCGSMLEGGRWIVSAGAHDRWVEIAEWDAADISRCLATQAAGSRLVDDTSPVT